MPALPSSPNRRAFVTTTGTTLSGAWLAGYLPAIHAAAREAADAVASGRQTFQLLTPAEAADLDAIAAQIIPTDATPGAREAGVVHFMDRALGTFFAAMAPAVREGLAELNARVAERFPGTARFRALGEAEQHAVLTAAEQTPFFGTVRFLTLLGMFGHPSYGGNRERLGWRLLEFDDRPAWAPPFGFYDRGRHEGGGP